MWEVYVYLLVDGGGGQFDIFIVKFVVIVGGYFIVVVVIEVYNGFIFFIWLQQSSFIDLVCIGQCYVKGGVEGVGVGVIECVVIGDD